MANLIFLDSFDHYATADLTSKWTTTSPVSSAVSIVANGRTGKGMQTTGITTLALPVSLAEIAVGFAARVLEQAQFTGGVVMHLEKPDPFGFMLSLQLQSDYHCRFILDGAAINTGHSPVWSPAAGNIRDHNSIYGPPSTLALHEERWHYIEIHSTITLAGTTLTFAAEAYLNEMPLCSITQGGTVDPVEYGSGTYAKYTNLAMHGAAFGSGQGIIYDDVYITDGELLGDVKVGVLYPNAAGSSSAMTPNGAGANYTMVNEHTPDGDTTYVAAATTGLTDLYNLDDIGAFAGTIKGAQACILSRKSDTGAATLQAEWRSAGSTIDGKNTNPNAVSYQYLLDPRRKSLFSAADWTASEIDALQIGQKRTA